MTVVLDVSAAIQLLLKKERYSFFSNWYQKADWVICPDLYISEITNVLWKYNKARILEHEQCQEIVKDGIDLVDELFDAKELWKEVLGESIKINHSVYDIFYAVLARRNDAVLISNDKELIAVCNKLNIENCG